MVGGVDGTAGPGDLVVAGEDGIEARQSLGFGQEDACGFLVGFCKRSHGEDRSF